MAVGSIVGLTQCFPADTATFSFLRLVTGAAFTLSPEQEARAEVVAWLPNDTCVAADDRIAGQLTHTNRVTVPGVSHHRQDFYVLDLSIPEPATTNTQWTTLEAPEIVIALGFREVYRAGGIIVFQSNGYTGPNPAQCSPFSN